MTTHSEIDAAPVAKKRRPIYYILIMLAIIVPIQAVGVWGLHQLTPNTFSGDFRNEHLPAAKSIMNGNGPRVARG